MVLLMVKKKTYLPFHIHIIMMCLPFVRKLSLLTTSCLSHYNLLLHMSFDSAKDDGKVASPCRE